MEGVRVFQRNVGLRQLFSQTRAPLQQSFRTRPSLLYPHRALLKRSIHSQRPTSTSSPSPFRSFRPQTQRLPRRNNNATGRRYNSSTTSSATSAKPSIKERLKTMSREYGWTAVGVYLALSALDFPFCFLAVRMMGTETIGHYEHVVVETFKSIVKWPIQGSAKAEMAADGAIDGVSGEAGVSQVEQAGGRVLEEETNDHGYKAAEKANRGDNASIWTQLALAYAVHKSFIFIRVPLTAAVLPKVVKTLRSWGYNIGKMPQRKAVGAGTTGINTQGSKVKPGD
ncbi:hypothetical protein AYO21_08568 [Fonsecaea monophora]|uniref:DUF1279 domain-containing protein n=1 Tax=Fonsecaea monophora TaxID=254056 RepID=A0A177F237_9EURO|nr:hypothetical protein AYO21_08568 [Fonsecaea monophora]KAH0844542.1 peptide alpha-N-acetyltransferase Nat2 [Fonsecaea pedrosoi]OAG37269.1 hypothetical protein AYO21_08568 [Fonsecaea monophora]